jgi:hypothetical protein
MHIKKHTSLSDFFLFCKQNLEWGTSSWLLIFEVHNWQVFIIVWNKTKGRNKVILKVIPSFRPPFLLFHAECFVDILWPLLVTCKVLVAQFLRICSSGPSWAYWIRAIIKARPWHFHVLHVILDRQMIASSFFKWTQKKCKSLVDYWRTLGLGQSLILHQ